MDYTPSVGDTVLITTETFFYSGEFVGHDDRFWAIKDPLIVTKFDPDGQRGGTEAYSLTASKVLHINSNNIITWHKE